MKHLIVTYAIYNYKILNEMQFLFQIVSYGLPLIVIKL